MNENDYIESSNHVTTLSSFKTFKSVLLSRNIHALYNMKIKSQETLTRLLSFD